MPLVALPDLFKKIRNLKSLLPIVVSHQKYSKELSYLLFAVAMLAVAVYPSPAYAKIASISGKVKSMFVQPEKEVDSASATSQTMALFKPVVIDEASSNAAEIAQSNENESLQVVSGSLRMSTEDVDFPTTDTISVYEVKKGDTLADVAKLFNVSVNTIIWANDLKSKTISKGDTLLILPITGIKHVVKKGDTAASIAKKYKADADGIARYNGFAVGAALTVGDTVLVPAGEIEVAQPVKKVVKTTKGQLVTTILDRYANSAPLGFFTRPLIGGTKTQGIHGHNGIDFGASRGTPVVGAAAGQVILAKMGGYNGGYGNMIIISHEGGIQTVYAHLQAIYISQGDTVTQGQVIGEVGNSGKSTGPHLHFEVRGAKNPF